MTPSEAKELADDMRRLAGEASDLAERFRDECIAAREAKDEADEWRGKAQDLAEAVIDLCDALDGSEVDKDMLNALREQAERCM